MSGTSFGSRCYKLCVNGVVYQAASHMLWEGMVTEGLAVTRAVHDRYHPSRRNPFKEVECGAHYARSMANYGVFLAAFTTTEGWGSFSQKSEGRGAKCEVAVRWGKLRLKTLTLTPPAVFQPQSVAVTLDGIPVPATLALQAWRCQIRFGTTVLIVAVPSLVLKLT